MAQAFPTLPIVSYHGWWPNVRGAIGVAFRYDNLYLVPDMYLFQPGSQAYVEAANSFLGDQLAAGDRFPGRCARTALASTLHAVLIFAPSPARPVADLGMRHARA